MTLSLEHQAPRGMHNSIVCTTLSYASVLFDRNLELPSVVFAVALVFSKPDNVSNRGKGTIITTSVIIKSGCSA